MFDALLDAMARSLAGSPDTLSAGEPFVLGVMPLTVLMIAYPGFHRCQVIGPETISEV